MDQETMSVGEILRTARLQASLSLEQLSHKTKVREFYLQALEDNIPGNLPGQVYALGFVRAYARVVGLDPESLTRQYRAEVIGEMVDVSLDFPEPLPENSVPTLKILLLSFGGCILLLLLWWGLFGLKTPKVTQNTIISPAKPVVVITPPAPPVTAPIVATVSEKDEPSSVPNQSPPLEREETLEGSLENSKAGKPIEMRLIATALSWIEIKTGEGQVIVNRTLQPGEVYVVPNQPDLFLTTGNAGGITARVENKGSQVLGRPAEVKRRISLDSLQKELASKSEAR